MIALIVYIYQSDYLLSSSVVVLSQPASVRVRQDVAVLLPPHTVFFSSVWYRLLSGRSAS